MHMSIPGISGQVQCSASLHFFDMIDRAKLSRFRHASLVGNSHAPAQGGLKAWQKWQTDKFFVLRWLVESGVASTCESRYLL